MTEWRGSKESSSVRSQIHQGQDIIIHGKRYRVCQKYQSFCCVSIGVKKKTIFQIFWKSVFFWTLFPENSDSLWEVHWQIEFFFAHPLYASERNEQRLNHRNLRAMGGDFNDIYNVGTEKNIPVINRFGVNRPDRDIEYNSVALRTGCIPQAHRSGYINRSRYTLFLITFVKEDLRKWEPSEKNTE